jgi:hypothetical protein
MTDLDELSRLLEQATPGPWFVYVHTGDGTTIKPGDDWTVYGKDRVPVVYEGAFTVHAAANAALIAALRNCAEELVRDARRYRWLVSVATADQWEAFGCLPRIETDGVIDDAIAQEQP